MKLFNVRLFLVFICLIVVVSGYGQKIVASQDKTGVTVKWQQKKFCKFLYIQQKNKRCNGPLLYYTPIFSCKGKEIPKRKKPVINFKEEIPVICEMMDSAKQFMVIDLCMININLEDYDDLYSNLIDKFAASEEWKKSVERRGVYKDGKLNYDYGLIAKVLRDEKILEPLDELLNKYGFRVAISHLTDAEVQPVSAKELKRLGKDETLQVPSPGPLWVQLSRLPRNN